jgi:DNA-binding HxlR family transcriptional regulator
MRCGDRIVQFLVRSICLATLLIIRDMMFFQKSRFEEFLESTEGISTNILTNRLKLLEDMGLVTKQPYSNHSRRMDYQLTDLGQSLRPVLKSMAVWGLRHLSGTQIPKGEEA